MRFLSNKTRLEIQMIRLYWVKFLCDGCGKVKRRCISPDGRGLYCYSCRKLEY